MTTFYDTSKKTFNVMYETAEGHTAKISFDMGTLVAYFTKHFRRLHLLYSIHNTFTGVQAPCVPVEEARNVYELHIVNDVCPAVKQLLAGFDVPAAGSFVLTNMAPIHSGAEAFQFPPATHFRHTLQEALLDKMCDPGSPILKLCKIYGMRIDIIYDSAVQSSTP